MNEVPELTPIITELCAEFVKKPSAPDLIYSDDYCSNQCEFFGDCKANHDACIKHEVDGILNTLSDREHHILKLRCGYEGKVRTQKDLGLQFNIATTRVQQIETSILRKLRHPTRIKKIQPFMNLALSRGKENFYARLFTKVFKLNQEQIQNILQDGPPIEEKKAYTQPMEQTRKEISPSTSIESLELSIRSFNCLYRAGFRTVEDILKCPPEKLLRIRNLGRKSSEEVLVKLKDVGFSDKFYEVEQYRKATSTIVEKNDCQVQNQNEVTSSISANPSKWNADMSGFIERLKRVDSNKLISIELKNPEYMTYTNGRKGVTIFANLTNRTNAPFKVKLQEFTLTHSNTQKVSDYNYTGYDFDEGYLFPDTIKAIGKIWVTEQWESKELKDEDYCVIVLRSSTNNKQYYYKFIYFHSHQWRLYDYYELD